MKITPRRARWIGRAGSLLLRLLCSTWRCRQEGPGRVHDDGIHVLWHGRMLCMAWSYRRTGAAVMISRHGDGEIIAQVIERLGYVCARGSSSRGASRAVLGLTREHGERPWVITPDGPRGPFGSVKEGLIDLAAGSGRPIVVLGTAASRKMQLRSWDRFTIPLPFARLVHWFDEPIRVPPRPDPETREALLAEVGARMHAADAKAAECLRSP